MKKLNTRSKAVNNVSKTGRKTKSPRKYVKRNRSSGSSGDIGLDGVDVLEVFLTQFSGN